MPYAFPAAAPTLSGDIISISRFLQSPTMIARRLRDYHDLRFVSDQMLTQRFRSSGGAVVYEQTEPFVSDRTVEAIGPGSEYAYANLTTGTGGLAAVSKWGQKVLITDEEIARNVYAGAAVDRQLRKVVNSVIKQVDATTMAAILSAVTQTFDVTATGGGVWTGATPTILKDILRARAVIYALNLGYKPDTIVLSDTQYAYIMTDTNITNAWRREAGNTPVYTGQVESIAGMNLIISPNLPATTLYLLDSTALGGMADEVDGAPGYAVADLAVQIKSIRRDEIDAWDLQGRRKTVPVVQEPGAAIRLINVGV